MTDREMTKHEVVMMESAMARRLLAAADAERKPLYRECYDEKWRVNLRMTGPTALDQARGASPALLPMLRRLTEAEEAGLEIGCGTGYLALELARMGRTVTGIDVSTVAIEAAKGHAMQLGNGAPTFLAASGIDLPFDTDCFDFVFSVEVLEHLHERDVPSHLAEVLRVLRPGGRYWMLTPNALMEVPVHDRWGIATRADDPNEVLDIHLKEWTHRELSAAMQDAGFERLLSPWRHQRFQFIPLLPLNAKVAADSVIRRAPRRLRHFVAMAGGAVGCSVIGRKPVGRRRS